MISAAHTLASSAGSVIPSSVPLIGGRFLDDLRDEDRVVAQIEVRTLSSHGDINRLQVVFFAQEPLAVPMTTPAMARVSTAAWSAPADHPSAPSSVAAANNAW